jgi:hypothetical protein
MTTTETAVYVTAVTVDEVFADPTYQRILDTARARAIASAWDRRLAGILELSDRGETKFPRYAVLDGQHRWAAAGYLQAPPPLVANVHSGLTVADEADLFDKLNRQRKQISTWDHWRARRAAGDELVVAIEAIAFKHGLRVHEQSGKDGVVTCCSTLEKIATSRGGIDLIDATFRIVGAAWGDQREAYDSPIILGAALMIYSFADKMESADRLIETLAELPPRRIRYTATAMRDTTPGSLAKLTAIVILNLYNKRPGPKLNYPPRWSGALPKAKAPASA